MNMFYTQSSKSLWEALVVFGDQKWGLFSSQMGPYISITQNDDIYCIFSQNNRYIIVKPMRYVDQNTAIKKGIKKGIIKRGSKKRYYKKGILKKEL